MHGVLGGLGWAAIPTMLLTALLAPGALAESEPRISLSVQGDTVLLYGTPLDISATQAQGAPVVFRTDGSCFVTNLAQQPAGVSRAIVMATGTGGECVLTASATGMEAGAAVTVTLRTEPGQQRARFKREGGRLKPMSTLMVAPRDQRTMQGQPVAFRVERGKGSCTVLRAKQHWVVRTTRPGACVIRATASAISDRYLPYAQPLAFVVR